MAKPRSALTTLVLLAAGIFVGYQLAVVQLQTEKVAGQVILSKRQFEHMLHSMDQNSWNQQRVTPGRMRDGSLGDESDADPSESIDYNLIKYDPTNLPPNVHAFIERSSCKRLWENNNSQSWFQEKFFTQTKPVWDWNNLNLSTEVFDWWNSIQPGNESRSQVLNLAKSLLPTEREQTGSHSLISRHTCRRCAVVGNSANIINSKYGAFIDAHNIVFRMNMCPTETYEEDVGSRVTHYIAYPESYYTEYLKNATLLFTSFKAADLQWLGNYLSSIKKPPDKDTLDVSRVQLYNPELMWNAKHIWGIGQGRYPSTGFLAAIFALYTCDEVNIFGYGPNRQGDWDHYYNNKSSEFNPLFQSTLIHNAEAELHLLHRLDAIGKITFFQGLR